METKEISASLETLLRCFICYSRVQDPRLCPQCAKMCCKKCITKWITERKSNCPYCRTSLSVEQLVNCRFMEDVYAELIRLETSNQKAEEKDVCKEHDTVLHYFCGTCSVSVCADCAMFSDEHKGHDFQKLDNVYLEHKKIIEQELKCIHGRLDHLQILEESIETNIRLVKSAKEDRSAELQAALQEVDARLTEQLKAKLLMLFGQKNEVLKESRLLESLIRELTCQLDVNVCPRSLLIKKSPDLLQMLKEIHKKPVSHFFRQPVSSEFHSELIPEYSSATAVFDLRQDAEVVYSVPLKTNGLAWRLKLYPNGNGIAKGTYLSIFLELSRGFPGSAKYEYRVEMLNYNNPDTIVSRVFASQFEVGECWGYNRFFRIDRLAEEGFLSPQGQVTLKFHVRSPNYYLHAQNQQRYIQQLEEWKQSQGSCPSPRESKLGTTTKLATDSYDEGEEAVEVEPEPETDDMETAGQDGEVDNGEDSPPPTRPSSPVSSSASPPTSSSSLAAPENSEASADNPLLLSDDSSSANSPKEAARKRMTAAPNPTPVEASSSPAMEPLESLCEGANVNAGIRDRPRDRGYREEDMEPRMRHDPAVDTKQGPSDPQGRREREKKAVRDEEVPSPLSSPRNPSVPTRSTRIVGQERQRGREASGREDHTLDLESREESDSTNVASASLALTSSRNAISRSTTNPASSSNLAIRTLPSLPSLPESASGRFISSSRNESDGLLSLGVTLTAMAMSRAVPGSRTSMEQMSSDTEEDLDHEHEHDHDDDSSSVSSIALDQDDRDHFPRTNTARTGLGARAFRNKRSPRTLQHRERELQRSNARDRGGPSLSFDMLELHSEGPTHPSPLGGPSSSPPSHGSPPFSEVMHVGRSQGHPTGHGRPSTPIPGLASVPSSSYSPTPKASPNTVSRSVSASPSSSAVPTTNMSTPRFYSSRLQWLEPDPHDPSEKKVNERRFSEWLSQRQGRRARAVVGASTSSSSTSTAASSSTSLPTSSGANETNNENANALSYFGGVVAARRDRERERERERDRGLSRSGGRPGRRFVETGYDEDNSDSSSASPSPEFL